MDDHVLTISIVISSFPSARAELVAKATTGLPFQAMQNAI